MGVAGAAVAMTTAGLVGVGGVCVRRWRRVLPWVLCRTTGAAGADAAGRRKIGAEGLGQEILPPALTLQ